MASIEAVAIIPGPAGEVWKAIVDHARWPEWSEVRGRAARLVRVEAGAEPSDRVGARRHCAAVLPPGLLGLFGLLGQRQATWTEVVADVRRPWALELEAPTVGRLLRRWRVRLTLVEQRDGRTRVRCRVSYRTGSAAAWLLERLLVRRAIATGVQSALAGLAHSLAARGDSAVPVGAAETAPQADAAPVTEDERLPDPQAASLAA
jgi:hypothetical protein